MDGGAGMPPVPVLPVPPVRHRPGLQVSPTPGPVVTPGPPGIVILPGCEDMVSARSRSICTTYLKIVLLLIGVLFAMGSFR